MRDVIQHICLDVVSGSLDFAGGPFLLRDEKKLSMAALSQTLPDGLIEHVMPWSAMRRWNCSLVYVSIRYAERLA